MVHAVCSARIGERAVPNPLRPHQKSFATARLNRSRFCKSHYALVKLFHRVRVGSVKGDVIDAENSRPGNRSLRIRASRDNEADKNCDERFHKHSIVARMSGLCAKPSTKTQ